MEPPHAHWAYHSHSDQQLNLMFRLLSRLQALEAVDPPRPYWPDHDHSDEYLNMTVSQQRSLFSSSPSRPDSGYCPSESHERPRMGIRVVDTTLTPPATPPATLPATPPATPTSIIPGLFPQDEESLALAALRTEEYAWSSGWEADSDSEEGSLERISKKDEKKKQNLLRAYASEKNSNNIFSRGLRRARRCVGKAVMATGRRISPCGGGVGNCGGVGGLDGEGGDKKGRRGGRGGDEGAFGKVVKRIKRSALFWKSEPVRLRPAKVRMVLD